VEISVDESLMHSGRQFLVEIDSANTAKLLVGQYVLLNQLYPHSEPPPFFLVVHLYKGYNPRRTVRNLSLVNQQLYGGKGCEFGAVHFSEFADCGKDFDHLLERVCRQ
jgi:hypothetical protein